MKTLYWTSTLVITAFLLISAYSYIYSKSTIEGIKALGFPDFFRIELAVLKLIAAFIITAPFMSLQSKEWAYAGTGFFIITAFVAHVKHKDSIYLLLLLVMIFGTLVLSNSYLHKTQSKNLSIKKIPKSNEKINKSSH